MGDIQISGTFKALIAVIILGVVAFFVVLNKQQREFEAQRVPSQSLETLTSTNRAQVGTHEAWCQRHKRAEEQLEDCVERRQQRVKLLKLYGECAQEQARGLLNAMDATERSALAASVLKTRGASSREAGTGDQAENPERVTERALLVKIKESLPKEASLAASTCAYQKLCTQRGHSGDALSECVAGMTKR